MKYKGYLVLLVCWLLLNSAIASAQQMAKPTHLHFIYNEHPTVKQYLLPMVQQAYANLGILVTFTAVPPQRAYQELSVGTVDGDVARPYSAANPFSHMLYVKPPIELVNAYLVCQPDISCQADDILRHEEEIYVPISETTINNLGLTFNAKRIFIKDWQVLTEMFALGRIEKMIWAEGSYGKSLPLKHAQKIRLAVDTLTIYHLIHKKYAYLVPEISAELAKLTQVNPDLAPIDAQVIE